MSNWIALHCGSETEELQAAHPNAFLLLALIARRARWKDCPVAQLKAGQAFIGDWKRAGLHSEMAYRHAKRVLVKLGFATFRGTSLGTVATLSNTTIFSISAEPWNGPRNRQGTDGEQTNNRQGTTNSQGHRDTSDTRDTVQHSQPAPVAIPPVLSTPSFDEAWQQWNRHLQSLRKALGTTESVDLLAQLEGMGEPRACAAIHHSIAQGWKRIFEEKPTGHRRQATGVRLNLGKRGIHANQAQTTCILT